MSEPEPSAPSPNVSFMGETLIIQAVRESVRKGVPAAQILDEYKQRGPQARTEAVPSTPQVSLDVAQPPPKPGFWARLLGRKS